MSAPSEAALAAAGPLATPRNEPTFGAATTGKVGMWIFLVTDAMTFAGLLLGYAILRAGNPKWPLPSTVLGIPCLTLRTSTERPVTVSLGTNELVGTGRDAIAAGFRRAMSGQVRGAIPPYWDGHTAERIVEHLGGVLGLAGS